MDIALPKVKETMSPPPAATKRTLWLIDWLILLALGLLAVWVVLLLTGLV